MLYCQSDKLHVRNDPSNGQRNPKYAIIRERLAAVNPSQQYNATGLEVAHNRATQGPSFIDDNKLRYVEDAGQNTALDTVSRRKSNVMAATYQTNQDPSWCRHFQPTGVVVREGNDEHHQQHADRRLVQQELLARAFQRLVILDNPESVDGTGKDPGEGESRSQHRRAFRVVHAIGQSVEVRDDGHAETYRHERQGNPRGDCDAVERVV